MPESLLAGDDLVTYGDGEQSRDFTPVAEAVRANLLAAEARQADSAVGYNVATGRRITVNEIARTVLDLTASDARVTHAPPRAGDVRHSLADLTRTNRDLAYEPATTLAEGLASCLDYYRGLFS